MDDNSDDDNMIVRDIDNFFSILNPISLSSKIIKSKTTKSRSYHNDENEREEHMGKTPYPVYENRNSECGEEYVPHYHRYMDNN